MADDRYQGHDYYLIDELLTEEHKLIRETVRTWVKQNVSPIIEEYAQKAEFPIHLLRVLAKSELSALTFQQNMVVPGWIKSAME